MKRKGIGGSHWCEIFPTKLEKDKYETHNGITNSVKLVPTGTCFIANGIGSGSLTASFSTAPSNLHFCLLWCLLHLKLSPISSYISQLCARKAFSAGLVCNSSIKKRTQCKKGLLNPCLNSPSCESVFSMEVAVPIIQNEDSSIFQKGNIPSVPNPSAQHVSLNYANSPAS